MSSYDLVRATTEDGGSVTMTEARAKRLGLTYTTEGAVNRHGRPLSPTLAGEETTTQGDVPATTVVAPDFSTSMKRDELDAEAARLGLDPSSFANKDELVSALNAAASGQEG